MWTRGSVEGRWGTAEAEAKAEADGAPRGLAVAEAEAEAEASACTYSARLTPMDPAGISLRLVEMMRSTHRSVSCMACASCGGDGAVRTRPPLRGSTVMPPGPDPRCRSEEVCARWCCCWICMPETRRWNIARSRHSAAARSCCSCSSDCVL